MVRRSASNKNNLSQDMIAETINQANNCFSILTTPGIKTTEKVNRNNQVVIMPEIANAVFFLKQVNHSNTRSSSQNCKRAQQVIQHNHN
jgi:hypothetical protein